MPLAVDSPFEPLRGRFCLDDTCLRLEDAGDVSVVDYAFDYSGYNLRRPVPCPKGTYCHPGTAVDVGNMKNFSTPQVGVLNAQLSVFIYTGRLNLETP